MEKRKLAIIDIQMKWAGVPYVRRGPQSCVVFDIHNVLISLLLSFITNSRKLLKLNTRSIVHPSVSIHWFIYK